MSTGGARWSRLTGQPFLVLACLLAGLALTDPRLSLPPRPPRLLVLADVSQSISAHDLDASERWSAAARSQKHFADVELGRFAASVESVSCPPSSTPTNVTPCLQPFGDARDRDTDLARALLWGASRGDPRAGDAIVVLSDGRDADERAAEVSQALQRAGWPLLRAAFREDAPSAPGNDVAVRSVALPPSAPSPRQGAPFRATVSLAATVPTRVRITAVQDGTPVSLPALGPSGEFDLPAGETTLELPLVFPKKPASTTVRVHVQAHDAHDAWPGNDSATATFFAAHPATVLLVEAEAQSSRSPGAALAALLGRSGFEVQRLPPTRLASAWPEAPPSTVWLLDIAAAELPARALAEIEKMLHAGGGLIVSGGAHAFERGGYAKSALEKMLPVLTDDNVPAEQASLALALVLDRSGSMAGPKLELTKEAARAAARLVPDGAWLGVVAFDSQPLTLVPLRPLTNRFRLESDLERLAASGGTNILAGLRAAIEEMRNVPARRKHVILLSDGQSSPEGVAALVDGAHDAGMTISTVAVGEGADQHLLRLIATRGGGRSYFTADPARLPRLFVAETLTVQGPPPPPVRPRLSLPKPHPITHDVDARELSPPPLPARTQPRAQSDVLLTVEGAPLLACWSVGLGRSCAFTAEPSAQGKTAGSTVASQKTAARLFTQLARYATKSAREGSDGEPSALRLPTRGNVIDLGWEPAATLRPVDVIANILATEGSPAAPPSGTSLMTTSHAALWRGQLRISTLPAIRGEEPLAIELLAHAPTGTAKARGPVHLPRDTEGPASWVGIPRPPWWEALPLAYPDLTPAQARTSLAASFNAAPPPRREWSSRTCLLVAAAASVIAAAWRRFGASRPHGAPYRHLGSRP